MQALYVPVALNRPAFQLGDGHKRDEGNAPREFRIVPVSNRVILEQKRDDICIYNNTAHAAGSVSTWPRHSWSVARKSSIDSSSGQKSPRSSLTSAIGPVPCSAVNGSIDG